MIPEIANMRSCVHVFQDMDDLAFCAKEYSYLKFGSDAVAKKFGHALADDTFAKHRDLLLMKRAVIIPSPFNVIPNAATIMAQHFMHRLNVLLVQAGGKHTDWSLIHRKVSYTSDYGFLGKNERKGLLDGDSFYLNQAFYEDKLLVFIDDVRITGAHEDKLIENLDREKIQNRRLFLYYAMYDGDRPDIESQINFAGIKTIEDYLQLLEEPDHNVIIRPIKFVMGQSSDVFSGLLGKIPRSSLEKIYTGCLAEGYYDIDQYKANFRAMEAQLLFQ